jgi:predicted amidophosphoribosyltransferase
MAEAFQVDEGLSGRVLVLVDDVITTGNTLHSGAATLKAVGASSVWGLVAARET